MKVWVQSVNSQQLHIMPTVQRAASLTAVYDSKFNLCKVHSGGTMSGATIKFWQQNPSDTGTEKIDTSEPPQLWFWFYDPEMNTDTLKV